MANEEEYEIDEEQRGLRHVGRGPLAEKGTQAPALVGELVSALNRMFPPADAEPWDRTGLLMGDPSAKIEGVACALDPTVPAVREAAQLGANVLVTHHPAFLDAPDEFKPLSARACVPGSVVFEAARLGVALANWHTALDVSAPAQSMLPGMLRLKPSAVLEPLARDESLGYGQICAVDASEGLTLGDLSARCMAVFGRAPRVWGGMDTSLSTVCTWTGGAGDAASECVKRGIDVLVCGEVKYHAALEASQQGLCIIELGHDVSELPFARILAESCARVGVAREKITLLDQNDAWQHPETRRV